MASSIQAKPAETILYRIFLLLTLAAAGMATLLALLPPSGHDQLWFLLMADRWLGAAHTPRAPIYGPQIFDSNPPGIVWLSALPILLARALHLSTTFAAKLLVILAESSASFLSLYFLRRTRPTRSRYELPALLLAALILFYLAPARDFGQRDHILSFLVLPYILASALDPRAHRLTLPRCLAGIIAAAGICLKPHHALVVLAVELTLLLTPTLAGHAPWPTRLRRLRRPEPILILLLGLLYLSSIHHFTPLYFSLTLPTLRDTYWAIGNLTLPALAWQAVELCLLAALSLFLFARTRPRSPVVALLLTAGLAATAAYAIQGTGWYYQQLPGIAFFGAALTLQLLNLIPAAQRQIPNWTIPATAAFSILALTLTAHFTHYPFTRDRAFATVFADESIPDPSLFTPNTSVAILTTSVEAAMMPVDRYHLTWAQRTDNLWLLPAILRSESPNANTTHTIPSTRLAQLEAQQHRWMVEDLTRWQPTLILIERCQDPTTPCQKLEGHPTDLLAWFLRDPAFATLWSHYTHTTTRGHFDAYTLTGSWQLANWQLLPNPGHVLTR